MQLNGAKGDGRAQGDADDDDANSEGSFDPLFDDPDADEGNENAAPSSQNAGQQNALPGGKLSQQQQQQQQSQAAGGSAATATARIANPRGPPVLDAASYGAYSPDVVMTASVDGAIVLWDRRVNTPGKGVGRLESSNKTPPWCVSVSGIFFAFYLAFLFPFTW